MKEGQCEGKPKGYCTVPELVTMEHSAQARRDEGRRVCLPEARTREIHRERSTWEELDPQQRDAAACSDSTGRELGSEYANVTLLLSSHLFVWAPHWPIPKRSQRAREPGEQCIGQPWGGRGEQVAKGESGGRGAMEDTQRNAEGQVRHNSLVPLGAGKSLFSALMRSRTCSLLHQTSL